jgi:hypothetical protein
LKIKEVQFNFACVEIIILYLFNHSTGKINQYQELVNIGEEVQFDFACVEIIILYLFNHNTGKINQYQELVNVGELQCLGMAVTKVPNIAIRFIIPSEDFILT